MAVDPPSQHKEIQSRQVILSMAISAAAKCGVVIEEVHIEDLYSIANGHLMPLSEREIAMYVRGISKTNQVSVTTTLVKLVNNVEALLSKNQRTMQGTTDFNKLLLDKMTLLSSKLDSISSSLRSAISAEHALTRNTIEERMNSLHNQIQNRHQVPLPSPIASTSKELPTHPSIEDIKQMCSNKLLLDKMTLVSSKLDSIIPSFGSAISAEHALTRNTIKEGMNSLHNQIQNRHQVPLSSPIASTSKELPTHPCIENIKQMCLTMGCPDKVASVVAQRYTNIISWEEYRVVMSGAITKEKFKEMLWFWKSMV